MTQYKGHIPGSGIQQHSAGELFPVYIEKVGDLWYAVHPEKRWRSIGVSTHASAEVISSIFLDRATSGVDHPKGRQRYEAELKARQNYVPEPQPEESSPAETQSISSTSEGDCMNNPSMVTPRKWALYQWHWAIDYGECGLVINCIAQSQEDAERAVSSADLGRVVAAYGFEYGKDKDSLTITELPGYAGGVCAWVVEG